MNNTEETTTAAINWVGQPRPRRSHPEIKRRAVQKIVPAVVRWLESNGEKSPDVAEVCQQLTESIDEDGYTFARNLDRDGWTPDAELVDTLSGVSLWHAEESCVKEWIAQNGYAPKLAIGSKVILSAEWVRRHSNLGASASQLIGEITATRDGAYTVFVEGMGHVRQGVGTHGMISQWEEIEAFPIFAA